MEIQTQLEIHQINMEDIPITPANMEQERKLQRKLHSAYRMEEDYWRKNSWSVWLQAGDKNTSFFHNQAKSWKHFNSVKAIQSQDQLINEFDGIKKATYYHFKEIYSENIQAHNDRRHKILDLVPSLIPQDSI